MWFIANHNCLQCGQMVYVVRCIILNVFSISILRSMFCNLLGIHCWQLKVSSSLRVCVWWHFAASVNKQVAAFKQHQQTSNVNEVLIATRSVTASMWWSYIIFCLTCIFNNASGGTQIFLAIGSSSNCLFIDSIGVTRYQPCLYKGWMNM
jgi:hypothetical protein